MPTGFSAHSKTDPKDGRLYSWGFAISGGFSVMKISAAGVLEKMVPLPLPSPANVGFRVKSPNP
jgi:all-trans-8'-apo-beta-carotenal 15,15'-oxygenase